MSLPPARSPALPMRSAWVMLLTLICGFALSQAYRTIAGILSVPLSGQFGLNPQQLGLVAAAFHFAFSGMQLPMGIGIDLYGIRRTIVWMFPLAAVGAAVSALAPSAAVLIAGQALIGVGCAPAFLVCTVFIARYFPAHRFAALSGLALGLGGLGLIFTGTPLAWLVERHGWRAGFWVLAVLSLAAWVLIGLRVHEPPASSAAPLRGSQRQAIVASFKGYAALLRMRHTAGILALVFVGYASFIALRGLWLAPYLGDRFGLSLLHSGHVALALSVISLFAPSLFGRLDPGDGQRRQWLQRVPWLLVVLFALLAWTQHAWVAIAAVLGVAVMSGNAVWQYADVRASYPGTMTGRAMALFTMSMFLGVAVMQSLTGAAAQWAVAQGLEPYRVVFGAVAVMLAIGIVAYTVLPKPDAAGSPWERGR